MTEYIPPVYKTKYKFPRKKKKKIIKDWGKDTYLYLIQDSWLPDGFLSRLMPEWYEREMKERKHELREKKLKRLCKRTHI